jgi:hypothetical protein
MTCAIFGHDVAQVLGCNLTAPIDRESVARFPRPQPIDRGIGSVEAVEHVFNQRDAVLWRQNAYLLRQRFGHPAHLVRCRSAAHNSDAAETAQAACELATPRATLDAFYALTCDPACWTTTIAFTATVGQRA